MFQQWTKIADRKPETTVIPNRHKDYLENYEGSKELLVKKDGALFIATFFRNVNAYESGKLEQQEWQWYDASSDKLYPVSDTDLYFDLSVLEESNDLKMKDYTFDSFVSLQEGLLCMLRGSNRHLSATTFENPDTREEVYATTRNAYSVLSHLIYLLCKEYTGKDMHLEGVF